MKIDYKSKFIFIVTSSTTIEDRFLLDIAFCIDILKRKNVKVADITVVTDMSPVFLVSKFRQFDGTNIIDSSHLQSAIEQAEARNLFIVSSCHGSIEGIDAATPIKPEPLTQAIKNNPFAENILVFFGQCYAGVFNYTDIKDESKNIVYIGATDINTSLSHNIGGWVANISVYAMFRWIEQPYDVDGDGYFSVTDLYKYTAWVTNTMTGYIEKAQASKMVDAQIQLGFLARQPKSTNPAQMQLELAARNIVQNYIIPHQDTWILNALPAAKMYFE